MNYTSNYCTICMHSVNIVFSILEQFTFLEQLLRGHPLSTYAWKGRGGGLSKWMASPNCVHWGRGGGSKFLKMLLTYFMDGPLIYTNVYDDKEIHIQFPFNSFLINSS